MFRSILSLLLISPGFFQPAAHAAADDLIAVIHQTAQEQQIDPRIIAAIVKIESDFNVNAVSQMGAQGLMQLMPVTQAEMKVHNPFDLHDNVRGGTAYFIKQYHRFNGDLDKALWAYNAGPSRVVQGFKPAETQEYIRRFYLYLHALTLASQTDLKETEVEEAEDD